MIGNGLARRYVKPLFDVAKETGTLEKVVEDIRNFNATLISSAELRAFLKDPSIERDAKKEVLKKAFNGASKYTLNFFNIVIEKNRTSIFPVVYTIFTDILNEFRGIATGFVKTAVKIDDNLYQEIKTALEKKFEKTLELSRQIDPEIIGGLYIRVGNTVIDASVEGQLDRLKETLVGA